MNCGTGQQVDTDSAGDAPSGIPASDLLRLAARSDSIYLDFWVKVNTVDVPTAAELGGKNIGYFIRMQVATGDCFWIRPVFQASGSWLVADNNIYVASCDPPNGNVSLTPSELAQTNVIQPQWFCNEARIRVPRDTLWLTADQPPADGSTLTVIDHYSRYVDPVTAQGVIDDKTYPGLPAAGVGTYKFGQQGLMYQNPPTGITTVVTGDNSISVAWTAPTDNGAQPVSAYHVYRNGVKITPSGGVAATSFLDTGAVSGPLASLTSYSYTVSSINCPTLPNSGEGSQSAATVIVPDFRPATPTAFAVTGNSATSLKLAWTAPTVDCPTFGASCPTAGSTATASGVKGYAVYRAVDPAAPVWLKNVPSDSTICTGTSCQWIDAPLTTGTKYCYVIRAYDGFQMSPPYTPPAIEPTSNMSPKTSPAQCETPAGAAPAPTCSASPSSVNTGQSTTFTGASGSGSYTWSGGETPSATGSGPTFTTAYSTTGTKTVTVTSGTQTGTCSVTVTAPLVPTCSASPATVVTSQSTTITGFGGDGTYTWSGGGSPATGSGANFMTSYTTTGTKTVTVTSNGQNSTCSVTVNLPGPPSCSGSPALATIGQTVVFTGASGNGVFVWSGGGSPATGGGVTFSTSFASTGTKSISVTSASQTATCNVTIQPNQPPVASFSAQPMSVQIGQPVSFVDASTDPDYNDYVAGWQWSFGDGYVATASGPTHSYATIGSYQACLVALDTHGVASASACRTISVQGAAGASQTPPPPAPEPQPVAPTDSDDGDDSDELAVTAPSSLLVRPGDEVALTAAAPDAKNPTWSWVQTYGSRVVLSEAQTANATFSAPQAETMLYFEAQARDGSRVGITGTRVVVRIDNTAPVAGANGPAAGEVGKVVAFDALTSMDVDGDMLQFRWIQVAGPTAVVADAERIAARFTPTEAGTYRFAVEVSDGRASGVAFHTVQVADAPEISQEVVKESGGDQVGSGVSNGDADSESATQASREAAAPAGNAGLFWVAGGLVIVGIVVAVSVALLKRRKITAPPA